MADKKLQSFNSGSGFTLVELIVAVGLFAVVVSIALGGFARALRTQRQVAALISANSNVSLAIEQMAREIRTGRIFCRESTASLCSLPSRIAFINSESQTVVYRLSGEAIERGAGGVFGKITGENVSVKYLRFILFGNMSEDGYLPRITVSIGVGAKGLGVSGIVTNLHTTVSSRALDT